MDFIKALTDFGFPMTIAGYLLFVFQKKIDNMDASINGKDGIIAELRRLTDVIQRTTRE